MSDERRERWSAALGYMHGVNPEPYVTAAMAVADAESVTLAETYVSAKLEAERSHREVGRLAAENARLRADRADVLREAADMAGEWRHSSPQMASLERKLRRMAEGAQRGD